jgi:hypothetical protein
MKRNPHVSFHKCSEKALEESKVVTEFSDNAFGDCKDFGEPHLIRLKKKPVGWFQLTDENNIHVIEILPEFQKQEIATETIIQLYGENPSEKHLTKSPASQAGAKLIRRFGIEPQEIY